MKLKKHIPVLLKETIETLSPKPGEIFIDATVGEGGHSLEIAKQILPGGRLLVIDCDPDSLKIAKENLKKYSENIDFIQDNFSNFVSILKQQKLKKVNGILLDLGFASHQMADSTRGLSFQNSGPLDMRLNPEQKLTAAEIIDTWSLDELTDLFHNIGQIKFAKVIAHKIVTVRNQRPIRTTKELVSIVKSVIPPSWRYTQKTHFATNIFRALRMAVNSELENLEKVIPAAIDALAKGGRLAVISFHSLESSAVKRIFKSFAKPCNCPPQSPICVCGRQPKIKMLTKKSIKPTAKEVLKNSKARSAQLRVIEKIK